MPELPKTMDEASREILRLRAQVATLSAREGRAAEGPSCRGRPWFSFLMACLKRVLLLLKASATGGRREGSDYSWGTLPDVTELAPATRSTPQGRRAGRCEHEHAQGRTTRWSWGAARP